MAMCLTCWNAVTKYFPLLTRNEKDDILWSGTCYPAGCNEDVDKQLSELEQKSNGSYENAMRITHDEFDKIWESTRHLRPRWDEEEQRWIEPEEQPGS